MSRKAMAAIQKLGNSTADLLMEDKVNAGQAKKIVGQAKTAFAAASGISVISEA